MNPSIFIARERNPAKPKCCVFETLATTELWYAGGACLFLEGGSWTLNTLHTLARMFALRIQVLVVLIQQYTCFIYNAERVVSFPNQRVPGS